MRYTFSGILKRLLHVNQISRSPTHTQFRRKSPHSHEYVPCTQTDETGKVRGKETDCSISGEQTYILLSS
ncbi:hypothetical protein X777_09288 [Ooceraea biroi]|uniref:Uncharacterized protein n=1 Tax=Ooceraea biroi TaxID=2015173 RepID=A0A026W7K1_OOCBI|nr:hypothetical protein X777_09288 [Ooceraea biroi]